MSSHQICTITCNRQGRDFIGSLSPRLRDGTLASPFHSNAIKFCMVLAVESGRYCINLPLSTASVIPHSVKMGWTRNDVMDPQHCASIIVIIKAICNAHKVNG